MPKKVGKEVFSPLSTMTRQRFMQTKLSLMAIDVQSKFFINEKLHFSYRFVIGVPCDLTNVLGPF